MNSRPALDPKYRPPAWICASYGLSRSTLYRLLGEGRLRAVKVGRSTLVEVESADALFSSLPSATFRSQAA